MGEENEGQLIARLGKLVSMANEAVQSGDTNALLESSGEIAALKKSIEAIQKSDKAAKLAKHNTEITDLLRTCGSKFDAVYKDSKKSFTRLSELGHDVEIVKYIVDVQGNEKTFIAGPKTKARVATSDGGGSKSTRTVTLANGTTMTTKDFVLAYANAEEKATKTYESWPTAMAAKIAKRVSATIS